MSIETLRADLARNIANSKHLPPAEAISEIWAFLETFVEETSEIDASLLELAENADDILQPETAQLFVVCLSGCRQVIAELRARIGKSKAAPDLKLLSQIADLDKHCIEGMRVIEEITIAPEEEEDDDGSDEEGEDANTPASPIPSGDATLENPDANG